MWLLLHCSQFNRCQFTVSHLPDTYTHTIVLAKLIIKDEDTAVFWVQFGQKKNTKKPKLKTLVVTAAALFKGPNNWDMQHYDCVLIEHN